MSTAEYVVTVEYLEPVCQDLATVAHLKTVERISLVKQLKTAMYLQTVVKSLQTKTKML